MGTENTWDLLIQGGQVVLENEMVLADIAVKNGQIAALGNDLGSADQIINADGLFILPGCVDAHVHFNDPRPEAWEGWDYGCRSAAAGGVTTVLEMPLNSVPPVTDPESWEIKYSIAEKNAIVDYALWGGLVDNNLEHLQYLHDQGAVAFKTFTAKALDFPMSTDPILYEGMKWAAQTNAIIAVHAENDAMTDFYKKKAKDGNRIDRRSFLEAYPEISELEAVNRTLFLAKKAKARVHIAHVSLAEAFEMIASAKTEQDVTAETCPHYLFFDDKDFVEIGPAAMCTPPIRNAANKEALWKQVLDGTIDIISSDYAPSPASEKIKGEQNIWNGWPGISGIQVMLSAVWTEGAPRGLKPERMAQLLATNPARIFGLYPQKGVIRLGADADFVLFDPNKKWVLDEDQLFSRSKMNAYLGRNFQGKVVQTVVRGKTVYDQGKIVEQQGKMLCPTKTK